MKARCTAGDTARWNGMYSNTVLSRSSKGRDGKSMQIGSYLLI